MDAETAATLVRITARLSAALFVAALVRRGFRQRLRPRWFGPAGLFVGFVVAHTVHFGAVLTLAAATGGENIVARGGWLAAMGVGALFYALVIPVAFRRIGRARGWLAGRAGAWFDLAAMVLVASFFLVAYVPRTIADLAFIAPTVLLIAGIAVYVRAEAVLRNRTGEP